MSVVPSDGCISRSGNLPVLSILCASGSLAIVHIELVFVYQSLFWVGTGIQEWVGILATTVAIFVGVYLIATFVDRLLRHVPYIPNHPHLAAFAAAATIGCVYVSQAEDAFVGRAVFVVASMTILLVFTILSTRYFRLSEQLSATVCFFAMGLAITATYATAEAYYAYPDVRADVLKFGALATVPSALMCISALTLITSKRRRQNWMPIGAIATAVLTVWLTPTMSAVNARETRDSSAPNLVLVTFDALRADYTSVYDGDASTPALESIASRGTVFESAYALAPWTVPSMHGLFASQYPNPLDPEANFDGWRQSVATYKFHSPGSTLAEQLRDSGYATAAYIGNPLLGNKEGILRGFDTARAWPAHTPRSADWLTHAPTMRRILERGFGYRPEIRPINSTRIVTRCAQRFIRSHRDTPFFLWVHFIDPHDPYDPPKEFRSQNGAWPLFSPASPYWATPQLDAYGNIDVQQEDREFVRSLYRGEIAYADQCLAKINEALLQSELIGETFICITADHGEEFWDHGRYGHGQSVYEELIHVPLIFAGAGIETQRISDPVSAIDLMPTIATLMGVEPNPSWKGENYSSVLHRETPLAEKLCIAQATNRFAWPNSYRMARLGSMKLIENIGDKTVQVFNIDQDPFETNDLSESTQTSVANLKQAFSTWLANQSESTSPDLEHQDDEMIELLKSMGYID